MIQIDNEDKRVSGKDAMKQSWIGYFQMFPDYQIEVIEIIEDDSSCAVFGYASGTYMNLKNKEDSNYWKVPTAWNVIVKNDKIKKCQVYADNSSAIEIYNRNKS